MNRASWFLIFTAFIFIGAARNPYLNCGTLQVNAKLECGPESAGKASPDCELVVFKDSQAETRIRLKAPGRAFTEMSGGYVRTTIRLESMEGHPLQATALEKIPTRAFPDASWTAVETLSKTGCRGT